MEGKQVLGYELRRKLGEGGMATVYYAENKLGKSAAVKVLKRELSVVGELRKRFEQEARLMARLSHPNIRGVLDIGEVEGCPAILMEYLSGQDLGKYVKQKGAIPVQLANLLWIEAVGAIEYAHSQGVIHRDIKPSNFFLTERGDLKLLDFGIAKAMDQLTWTLTGQQMGTLLYMSPEQVKDPKRVGKETDYYSLGVTFYHLLTGNAPYDSKSESGYQIQTRIVQESLDLGVLPKEWQRVLGRCLAKDPLQRAIHGDVGAEQVGYVKGEETLLEDVKDAGKARGKYRGVESRGVEGSGSKRRVYMWVLLTLVLLLTLPLGWWMISGNGSGGGGEEAGVVKAKEGVSALVLDQDSVGWKESEGLDNIEAYRSYLSRYPEGKYKGLALKRIGELEELNLWKEVSSRNMVSGYESYVSRYPTGKYVGEARVAIAGLEEGYAWEEAKGKNTIGGYNGYLSKYPTGKNVEEARRRKKGLEDESKPKLSGVLSRLEGNMVYVEGGSFRMGCTGEQGGDCYDDERPVHEVRLSGYYIGKYEVTQGEWREVMGNSPSYFGNCDQCPVKSVNWSDVQEFIGKLNSQTGKNYRLPTEAEWEYAARGGKSSRGYKYSGSNNLGEVGWYDGNSGGKTHPVGQKRSNELGLYDMSGNVREWCSDWYGDYSGSSQTNPRGPSTGNGRVSRGGSWYGLARFCRVSYRNYSDPTGRYNILGFRLARSSS